MKMITKKTSDLSDIDFNQGAVILINKPVDWTSFKVVEKVRRIIKAKKLVTQERLTQRLQDY